MAQLPCEDSNKGSCTTQDQGVYQLAAMGVNVAIDSGTEIAEGWAVGARIPKARHAGEFETVPLEKAGVASYSTHNRRHGKRNSKERRDLRRTKATTVCTGNRQAEINTRECSHEHMHSKTTIYICGRVALPAHKCDHQCVRRSSVFDFEGSGATGRRGRAMDRTYC